MVSSPGIELNLRGKLVEDGLEELERYLEKAYSSGLLFVRIVHGKGTGKLREAVRNALKSSPYVASFEEPKDNEGGAGVTVAKMAVNRANESDSSDHRREARGLDISYNF
jgi:DNA mismatch repair protein MutS2